MDPRQARCFRFVRHTYAQGVAELVYAFDDGAELVERIFFPNAPTLPAGRETAFAAGLQLLHLIVGISYYKAGVPEQISIEGALPDQATAALLDELYLHGLAEFAYRNGLDLRGRIRFPHQQQAVACPPALGLAARSLVPLGGGKDSLVSVEALRQIGADISVAWISHSPLIEACAERTALPTVHLQRELAPGLFELNRLGGWNGHVPVTAINSAILLLAALIYDYDTIAFSNERSASAATLEYAGQAVNHQWSKGYAFEQGLQRWIKQHLAADLNYTSLLRPYAELAVTRAFARLGSAYFEVFSSCNRNFRILGPRPADRWCGQCPKCHFVFLALAPFMPKPRLLAIFGRNLLDDESQQAGFDALLEYHDHKPFECVGEGGEARAAMHALGQRPEWREDALVNRFVTEILPQLEPASLALEPWLVASPEHQIPARLQPALALIAGQS